MAYEIMCSKVGGSRQIVEKLIDLGAEVDATDEDGNTALMYAAHYANAHRFIPLLLKRAKLL